MGTNANLFEALPLCVEDDGTQLEKLLDNIVVDFNPIVHDYLTQMIKEIEESDFDIIDDDYVESTS